MIAPARRPLEVTADLELTGPSGARLQVTGRGAEVRVAVADFASLWHLARSIEALRPHDTLALANRGLEYSGLRVELTVGGQAVASVAAARPDSLLARMTGLPRLRVHPLAVLRALLK